RSEQWPDETGLWPLASPLELKLFRHRRIGQKLLRSQDRRRYLRIRAGRTTNRPARGGNCARRGAGGQPSLRRQIPESFSLQVIRVPQLRPSPAEANALW